MGCCSEADLKQASCYCPLWDTPAYTGYCHPLSSQNLEPCPNFISKPRGDPWISHALIRLVFSQVGLAYCSQKWNATFFGPPCGCPQLGVPAATGLYEVAKPTSEGQETQPSWMGEPHPAARMLPKETTHWLLHKPPSKEWVNLLLEQPVSHSKEFKGCDCPRSGSPYRDNRQTWWCS